MDAVLNLKQKEEDLCNVLRSYHSCKLVITNDMCAIACDSQILGFRFIDARYNHWFCVVFLLNIATAHYSVTWHLL